MHTVRDQITLTQEEQELFTLLLESAKHASTGTTLRCAGGWVRDKLLGKESKDIDVALDNLLGRDFADKVCVCALCVACSLWLRISTGEYIASMWKIQRGGPSKTAVRMGESRQREASGAFGCCSNQPKTRHTSPFRQRQPKQVNEYLESQGKETRKAAVIHSNPEQSKHLETARMKVHDLWIDLVNLRSETYAEGSRIPTMEFGTPLQDAERRCVAAVVSCGR